MEVGGVCEARRPPLRGPISPRTPRKPYPKGKRDKKSPERAEIKKEKELIKISYVKLLLILPCERRRKIGESNNGQEM
jgi:hypothetical protein